MRMCDLPRELVEEKILTRVPITSLKAVRSTCKTWDALTKNWILGEATRHQFLGFMTMNFKVYSLSFYLCGKEEGEDLVDVSVNQVDLLNQVEISKVFHCDGLLLCVAKDNSKLVVWNPYLSQTRWIGGKYHRQDRYALGYDKKRNHKILRFVDDFIGLGPERIFGYEIYEISSCNNSWRVLEGTPEWEIDGHQRGVSVKGNTYFFAHEKVCDIEPDQDGLIGEVEDFLLCFDFTKERFGQPLPLPFHSYYDECVTLSCVRDEQLAVLYFRNGDSSDILEIWVTITIEPDVVSWSKFLKVEMRPFRLTGFNLESLYGGSFFVDEEEKVAVVFELDGYLPNTKTCHQHTAFVFGQDGYFKSVNLGEATILGKRYCPYPALVCSSSYRPSLVQVKQPMMTWFESFLVFLILLVIIYQFCALSRQQTNWPQKMDVLHSQETICGLA